MTSGVFVLIKTSYCVTVLLFYFFNKFFSLTQLIKIYKTIELFEAF